MPQPFERRTISFIVRLWVEPMGQQDESLWRGQIEHVGSGEKAYFEDIERMLVFIEQRTGKLGRSSEQAN